MEVSCETGGSLRPLTNCTNDCALFNGCRIGGYQCERCGEWYCGSELNEDNLCEYCEEAERLENEEGDEE